MNSRSTHGWMLAALVGLFHFDTSCVCTAIGADTVTAATVEEAIKVIDLRALPLPEGAVTSDDRVIGSLSYEAKADPKKAFQFQQQQLIKLGWKELPGSMAEATYGSGMFLKSNFVISVTTTESGPDKAGSSQVYLTNFGNVSLTKLPVIKNAKSVFANEATAMYSSETAPADVAAATRKLLLDAGWEPYGTVGQPPENVMMSFKKNAIQITANVSVAPAQGNKTSIMYSALLLSADIPAPATAEEVQFVDTQKTLRFTSSDSYADVAKFYQQKLSKQGWKPTTDELVTATDQFKRPTGMLIFRNAAKDYLSLDLETRNDKTQAVVKHLTADELARVEKQAKEAAQKLIAEKEARKKKEPLPKTDGPDIDALIGQALKGVPGVKGDKVGIPILGDTIKKATATSDNVLQIKLGGGKGKAGAEFIRDQLLAAGWKLEDGSESDTTSGNFTMKKGTSHVTLTFVDPGIAEATLMIIGIGTKIEATKVDPDAEVPSKKPTTKK